jgi:enterochelin esterase family protein
MGEEFSAFRTQLAALAGDPAAATALADQFLAAHAGAIPIIEGSTAHFLARAPEGQIVGVGGEWAGMDPSRAIMEPIGGGLVHYAHTLEPNARLDYLFFAADAPRRNRQPDPATLRRAQAERDPLNPRIGASGLGARSELAMPGYRRPAITEPQPGTPPGSLHDGVLLSRALGGMRAYTVYLPVGYDPAGGPYACAVFHDGGDYLHYGEAPTILDNLIAAGTIPPLVAIFVPPQAREVEYNCDDRHVRFLADELLPALTTEYALSPDRMRRAVIGPSLGGLISLYIGRSRPEVFGLIAAQSTATGSWRTGYEARRPYAAPPLPLRVHLAIGSYEGCFAVDRQGRCRDLLTPARALRDVLARAGVPHAYVEPHQSHSWGMWRDTLGAALEFLFGRATGSGKRET